RQKLHDHITGLANQLLFQDRVSQALTQARKNRERLALLALDLDSFKKVNDSLGHTVGNALLQRVAERLTGAAREVDTVARLSGDLFTFLLPGIGTPETAGVVAEKILEAIRRPFHIGEHELYMTASVGIALYPDDGTQAEMLLKNADSALHRAKDMGRNRIQIYAADMNELAQVRLARESELHNALRRDELRVLYQPQIDLRSGRIVGVEALVRWEHPRHGLLAPDEFVPLAEESGLITELDFWVMRRACAQLQEWDIAGLPAMTVAVNLSGRHFETDRLPDNIARILHESGVDPARLELEVTEGVAVRDGAETLDALRRLRRLGVRFAIDDFGTGYSVLGRLRRFPVDRLKIDRSFISEIKSPSDDAPIVVAMIAMGRSLHLEVVAEGVETLEQQTFLRNHGCDQAQGYLFSRPVSAADIVRLLQTPSRGLSINAAAFTESA
ncbi:MAG: putative bifunctional diguanylate cyclase/phosphodiesterase, partial [Actinomycetota bacterium]